MKHGHAGTTSSLTAASAVTQKNKTCHYLFFVRFFLCSPLFHIAPRSLRSNHDTAHTDSLASGPECYPNFKHPWIWTAEWMGMASKRGVMYVCICMFVASLLNKCAHKYVCTWSQQSKTWRLLIPAGPTWVPWSSCTWLVSTKSAMILRALEGKPSTAYTAL